MTTDAPKQRIYKPKTISGFPEWLPEVRLVEQQWFDHIRRVFESYGFCSIETPSVEELDVLRAKGEVDKEIYVLERLHKDDNDKGEARLALHFDQTVPLARYVAQNFNNLVFPFKRYQMQRVWRGERPQAGRFREFYQCDIDVIGVDNLPIHFDAEMPAIMWEVMSGLPGMQNEIIEIKISNRKILLGYLKSIGLDSSQCTETTRIIDKMSKIGLEETYRLISMISADETQSEKVKRFIRISFQPYHLQEFNMLEEHLRSELLADIIHLDTYDPSFETGINELASVLKDLSHLPEGAVVADLSIVRGLDYYTGTVYETVFRNDPGYGSICSGGRYDDLAGSYINKHLPGVGISIGFSRLFARMVDQGKIDTTRKSPADVMVMMPDEDKRNNTIALCQKLRARGLRVEMYHAAKKFPDQLKYASRKGIPFIWITEEDGSYQVKNMATGEQSKANPDTWTPEGFSVNEAV